MGEESTRIMLQRLLRCAIVFVSLAVVLLFGVTALRRLHYPFELEELEGYVFLSALRVFEGQPLYAHPSPDFVPYVYPPFYFMASAAMGKVMGMTIPALRLVSIVSTFGCFGMIYALVYREARRHRAAVAATGLYAGCYTLSGCWYDLGRLDAMFILLLLLAMYATRYMHPVLAAAMWLLCFFTKQSILPAALVMLCFDWKRPRRTVSGVLTLVTGGIASVAWMDHVTGGWYSFYLFRVPAATADIKLRTLVLFLPGDLFRPLGLALVLILAALFLTRPQVRSPGVRFYMAACSLVPLFCCIRSHVGSTGNADMPVYALVALLFGIAVARLEVWGEALGARGEWVASSCLSLAVLVQLSAGLYNPGDYVPSADTRAALSATVDQIRRTPGDVYVTLHPYYGWLAGKPVQADLVALRDAERASPAVRLELQAELQSALAGTTFSALAFDGADSLGRMDALVGSSTWRPVYGTPALLPASAVPHSPSLVVRHR